MFELMRRQASLRIFIVVALSALVALLSLYAAHLVHVQNVHSLGVSTGHDGRLEVCPSMERLRPVIDRIADTFSLQFHADVPKSRLPEVLEIDSAMRPLLEVVERNSLRDIGNNPLQREFRTKEGYKALFLAHHILRLSPPDGESLMWVYPQSCAFVATVNDIERRCYKNDNYTAYLILRPHEALIEICEGDGNIICLKSYDYMLRLVFHGPGASDLRKMRDSDYILKGVFMDD